MADVNDEIDQLKCVCTVERNKNLKVNHIAS